MAAWNNKRFCLNKKFLGFYSTIISVTLEIRKSITKILVLFDIQHTFFSVSWKYSSIQLSNQRQRNVENIKYIVNQTENDLLKLVVFISAIIAAVACTRKTAFSIFIFNRTVCNYAVYTDATNLNIFKTYGEALRGAKAAKWIK